MWGRGATQLDKYHDGGLTPSRDAATRHLGGARCRGGRGEHSFSSAVTSQHQSPVIGQKYDVIITSSRGPPSLSAVIRAEVNRSVNTLSAAVTPSY